MARIAKPLYGRMPRRPPAEPARVGPVHAGPPGDRALRTQAVHRLQIGLFGLGGVLLMVGLANIVMERARQSEVATATAAPPAAIAAPTDVATTASDPLVDMGVAPELPVNKPSPSAKPDATVLPAGNTGGPPAAQGAQKPSAQAQP
ncbi:MAG: hypothetical protein KGL48_15190 [Sphingomonadales bacterium]|nr:hypothetical protein [Sphingomonadales bacterium]MDE2567587.1 hypothetical protein [Sphingomonadales bacterium]